MSVLSRSLNTFTVLFLAYGVANRRRPSVHMRVMISCCVLDVATLLLVELTRGAVGQAVETASGLLRFHVTVSALFICGYVVAIVTGRRLHRRGVGRTFHRINAAVFGFNRLASYVTSFLV